MGLVLSEAGLRSGLEVSWIPSYGPEMRGGTAHCHVNLASGRIGSPLVSRPTPEAPQPAEVASREIATDYIPIGYNAPLSPNEFAQIIRVSVPRSDMAQFGLPIRLRCKRGRQSRKRGG